MKTQGSKIKWTAAAALGMALLAQAPGAQAAWATIKAGEEIPAQRCRANPRVCQCAPGLVTKSYLGSGGSRYIQCVSARCPAGEVFAEGHTRNGKMRFSCETPIETDYAERFEHLKKKRK